MTMTEYLKTLSDADLIKHLEEVSPEDDNGWVSCTCSFTPFGTLTKTLIEREIDHRMVAR
jgi:hypothetical protein